MTDTVKLALIAAMVAIIPSLLAFFTLLITKRTESHVIVARQDIAVVKDNILTVEKATNSMKDALVKVTGEAEFAKGLKSGIETATQVQKKT